jgi:glutamine synthetase
MDEIEMEIQSKDPVILEYIWLDGHNNLRSKYRTCLPNKERIIDVDTWNYDGSSTYQASTENSEILLNPVAYYPNPFFPNHQSYLVMCDTYREVDGIFVPTENNHRKQAAENFKAKPELLPWFGIEQEYFIMAPRGTRYSDTPVAFHTADPNTEPVEQGDYYCGVGNRTIQMRKLAEKHYEYCLSAGLKISGINAEVAPDQWEFQVGPCLGVSAGDELWVARYILHKLSEEFNVNICIKPKPLPNPWNGSGLHTNFSTEETRAENGLDAIHVYIERLSGKHAEHIAVYGDNSERLNGRCETSDINTFSFAAGSRGASIRIPKTVLKDKRGYFEDRRPASDADPYQVISIIYKTSCLVE